MEKKEIAIRLIKLEEELGEMRKSISDIFKEVIILKNSSNYYKKI